MSFYVSSSPIKQKKWKPSFKLLLAGIGHIGLSLVINFCFGLVSSWGVAELLSRCLFLLFFYR